MYCPTQRSLASKYRRLGISDERVGLYQQLLECTVDIRAILTGKNIFP
jgi:hypothetical protein